MKPFSVEVNAGLRTKIYYRVTMVSNDGNFETLRITRDDEYLVLRSNRPMLRAKGLKHKRPDWKRVAGNMVYASYIKEIITGIENKLG